MTSFDFIVNIPRLESVLVGSDSIRIATLSPGVTCEAMRGNTMETINPEFDRLAVDSMRERLAKFRQNHPEFDCSADMGESLVFPNSSLKRHLRNKKDSAVGSGEKESGRSLAWVIRWQERKANRKARKLSRRAEGKIGKADRIVSYEKQKIHNPESELVFIEDAERTYRAQLNFMRIISSIPCVPESMRITNEDV